MNPSNDSLRNLTNLFLYHLCRKGCSLNARHCLNPCSPVLPKGPRGAFTVLTPAHRQAPHFTACLRVTWVLKQSWKHRSQPHAGGQETCRPTARQAPSEASSEPTCQGDKQHMSRHMSRRLKKSGDEKAFNAKESAARRCQRVSTATTGAQVGDDWGRGWREQIWRGFSRQQMPREGGAWRCLRARKGSSVPTSS